MEEGEVGELVSRGRERVCKEAAGDGGPTSSKCYNNINDDVSTDTSYARVYLLLSTLDLNGKVNLSAVTHTYF